MFATFALKRASLIKRCRRIQLYYGPCASHRYQQASGVRIPLCRFRSQRFVLYHDPSAKLQDPESEDDDHDHQLGAMAGLAILLGFIAMLLMQQFTPEGDHSDISAAGTAGAHGGLIAAD